jgi:protein-tyrosine kinase
MTGGSIPSDKPMPFNEDALKARLGEVREQFDYVIFDGNSVFGSSEVVSFAKHFDAVVLVVECEKTKWEVLQMASEKIQKAGGDVLGVVLNKRKYYIPDSIYRIMSKR